MAESSAKVKAPGVVVAALSVALAASAAVVPPAWAAPMGAPGSRPEAPAPAAQSVADLFSAATSPAADPAADQGWDDPFRDAEAAWAQIVEAAAAAPVDGTEVAQPDTTLDTGLDPARLSERLDAVVVSARSLLGRPYVWGGSTPIGFDCSGFTSFLYGRYNVRIPRTAEEQFHAVNQISRDQARPGDLVFFPRSDGFVYHVAIYAGDGMIIEARNPRVGVLLDPIWASNVTFGSVRDLGHRPGGYVTGRFNPAPISTGVGYSVGPWNGSASGGSTWIWLGAPSGGLPKQPAATPTPTPPTTPSPKPTPTVTTTATPTATPTPTVTTTAAATPTPTTEASTDTPAPTPTATPPATPPSPTATAQSTSASPAAEPTKTTTTASEPTKTTTAPEPTKTTATTAAGPSASVTPTPTPSPTPAA